MNQHPAKTAPFNFVAQDFEQCPANTRATPRYQQMPEYNPSWPNAAPTTNYACVAAMQRAGYGMGQSMQMCTR